MLKCLCCSGGLEKIPAESLNWSTSECKYSLISAFTRQLLAKVCQSFCDMQLRAELNVLRDVATICCAGIDFPLRVHFAMGCFRECWLWNGFYSHLFCFWLGGKILEQFGKCDVSSNFLNSVEYSYKYICLSVSNFLLQKQSHNVKFLSFVRASSC